MLHVRAGLDVETLLKIQEDEEKRDKIARRNLDISNNPLNTDAGTMMRRVSTFKRLTRLLSGPIVNRRVQMQRRYRRAQLDKFNFTSAGGLNFKRTSYNPYDNLSAQVMANQNRQERYIDFDQMEYTPEIASALDIYADEMTTFSQAIASMTLYSMPLSLDV